MKTFILVLVILFFCACCSTESKKQEYTTKTQTISLYPGYLAKSNGVISWFPQKPTFYDNNWIGESSVSVSSCIADPWPYTEGDISTIMKLEQ